MAGVAPSICSQSCSSSPVLLSNLLPLPSLLFPTHSRHHPQNVVNWNVRYLQKSHIESQKSPENSEGTRIIFFQANFELFFETISFGFFWRKPPKKLHQPLWSKSVSFPEQIFFSLPKNPLVF